MKMHFYRKIRPKKPNEVLRAVPETAACTAVLPFDQQDLVMQPDLGRTEQTSSTPCNNQIPPIPETEVLQPNNHDGIAIISSTARVDQELKSALSVTSHKGAIGTYRHGEIEWLNEDHDFSKGQIKDGLGTTKSPELKIHSVIPSGTQDGRNSAKPFLGHTDSTQISPDPADHERCPEISSPSCENNFLRRDSVVSPLTKPQPVPLGRLRRSIGGKLPRKYSQANRYYRRVSETSTCSADLQESDASSTYSNQSSGTSVGTEGAPTNSMTMDHTSIKSNDHHLFNLGVSELPHMSPFQSDNEGVEPERRKLSAMPPLRQYKHHPPIEHDQEFQPTCKRRPAYLYGTLTRQPASNNQSLKQSSRRSSLASSSSMGLINQALGRSTSGQLSNPLAKLSPTLSEAENELHDQLTSLADNPTSNELTDDVEQQPEILGYEEFRQATNTADQLQHNGGTSVDSEPYGRTQEHMPSGNSSPSPPLPRRSSKRQSLLINKTFRLSRVPNSHIAFQGTRSCSNPMKRGLRITIPEYKRKMDDFVLSPTEITPTACKQAIAPDVAEDVILRILQSLSHFDDLFATATINSAFYRVFKRHEMDLIKLTLWKLSPPAWEYRQVAFPGHDSLHDEDLEMTRPQEEYTPSTYLQLQARDTSTIRAIKSLIKERCQSFLRPDISVALVSQDPVKTARVDDALWRIWTFCTMFGSAKGREHDVTAQMDWLRGGSLVHQPACTFSVTTTDYMNSTLASAPEHFAKGNAGGLTAEQLFDIMELWNCLGVLLQGFEGQTAQAREFGIYDNTDIRGGDIDGEDTMLDEWCYYLLTFGLSTVLKLAGPHLLPDSSPFMVASWNGWTAWKPPVSGSTRRNFLKEAASRVYEDKIAHVYAESSSREVQREISKARIQKYITELQQRKNSGERIPMSQERPMSEWDSNGLMRSHPALTLETNLVSYIPSLRSATSNYTVSPDLSASVHELSAVETSRSSSPLRRTVAEPLLPTPTSSTVPSTRDRSSMAISLAPINEYPDHGGYREVHPLPPVSNHPVSRSSNTSVSLQRPSQNNGNVPQAMREESSLAAFWQPHTRNDINVPIFSQPRTHNDNSTSPISRGSNEGSPGSAAHLQHDRLQNMYNSESHLNTADKAIYRIVEMGFTSAQAREALRITDRGDGLRVDRAVELLLRRAM